MALLCHSLLRLPPCRSYWLRFISVTAIRRDVAQAFCTWPSHGIRNSSGLMMGRTAQDPNLANQFKHHSLGSKLWKFVIANHLNRRWLILHFGSNVQHVIHCQRCLHEIKAALCQPSSLGTCSVQRLQVVNRS